MTNTEAISIDGMRVFCKKKTPTWFVRPLDIAEKNEEIIIHTVDGPEKLSASNEFFIMCGAHNDVYPISEKTFNERYRIIEQSIAENIPGFDGVVCSHSIKASNIHMCELKKPVYIYARKLDKPCRILLPNGNWNYGDVGDYIACAKNTPDHFYIIRGDIFLETYEPAD